MNIHLTDLKRTMTRGGQRYYVTLIDDFFRYIKVYLLRNNYEAFDIRSRKSIE